MCNYITVNFNRSETIANKADFGEKIGNFGLGLLRIGFGKTVKVQQSSNSADDLVFASKVHSTGARVAAVALFVLAIPITGILAGIGSIATICSKSYKHIFDVYSKHKAAQNEDDLNNSASHSAELDDESPDDLPPIKTRSSSPPEDSTPPNIKTSTAPVIETIDLTSVRTSNPFSEILDDEDFFKLPGLDLSEEKLGYRFTGSTGYPDSIKEGSVPYSVMVGINGFKGHTYLLVKHKFNIDGENGRGLHVFFKDEKLPDLGINNCFSHSDDGLELPFALDLVEPKHKNSYGKLGKLIKEGKLTDANGNTLVELA